MAFIQIIDATSSRVEEIQALEAEMRAATGGLSTPVRRMYVTKDRDRENHYLTIVEFESYEAAMANSNDPRTQEFAEKFAALCDGPPAFYNLDVISEEAPGA
jgi:quinol monooxygenase YgiN